MLWRGGGGGGGAVGFPAPSCYDIKWLYLSRDYRPGNLTSVTQNRAISVYSRVTDDNFPMQCLISILRAHTLYMRCYHWIHYNTSQMR